MREMVGPTRNRNRKTLTVAVLLLSLAFPMSLVAGKKKKDQPAPAKPAAPAAPQIDVSKLAWPGPPSIARVRYLNYFAGQKLDTTPVEKQPKKKSSWMDRLAGVSPEEKSKFKPVPFQLLGPYGMAVDSKGQLYVADQKVGAVFVFNTETRDANLIRNGFEAQFALVNYVAIDDDDRVFVTDGKLHRVLVLSPKWEVINQIRENLLDPVGIAIDTENRLLYVVDTQQDQVFVYDADSLKPVRRIGTSGKKHELTEPGAFSAPTAVAVDSDGNVYVTDTMNYRVEIFDADGNFISQFGKHCDGPGCFAHPKGIAVDGDGHIWVADPMLDLLQAFNRDGQLLGIIGGHGTYLGQFSSLVNVTFDKKTNRLFTTEQYPGRVQMFRYITDAEAAAEQQRRDTEQPKSAQQPVGTPAQKPSEAPAQKESAPVKAQSSAVP